MTPTTTTPQGEGEPVVLRLINTIEPIRLIQREVCEKYGIRLEEMLSERRWDYVCRARQEGYWRARMETPASLPQIGALFNRDHTTVMHGIKAHEKRIGMGV